MTKKKWHTVTFGFDTDWIHKSNNVKCIDCLRDLAFFSYLVACLYNSGCYISSWSINVQCSILVVVSPKKSDGILLQLDPGATILSLLKSNLLNIVWILQSKISISKLAMSNIEHRLPSLGPPGAQLAHPNNTLVNALGFKPTLFLFHYHHLVLEFMLHTFAFCPPLLDTSGPPTGVY